MELNRWDTSNAVAVFEVENGVSRNLYLTSRDGKDSVESFMRRNNAPGVISSCRVFDNEQEAIEKYQASTEACFS